MRLSYSDKIYYSAFRSVEACRVFIKKINPEKVAMLVEGFKTERISHIEKVEISY